MLERNTCQNHHFKNVFHNSGDVRCVSILDMHTHAGASQMDRRGIFNAGDPLDRWGRTMEFPTRMIGESGRIVSATHNHCTQQNPYPQSYHSQKVRL